MDLMSKLAVRMSKLAVRMSSSIDVLFQVVGVFEVDMELFAKV